MEAVEFLQCYYKMCNSNVSSCVGCEAQEIDCELTTDKPERLVAIVEKWAKEHTEKPEHERQKPEHQEEAADVTNPKQDEPCVKTIQDNIEGAIYRSIAFNKTRIENLEYEVSVIRHDLEVLDDRIYALREKVDHTPAMEPSQTPEPKRTNKDVLLAAFPRMVMDGVVPVLCPRTMDRDIHIQYCSGRSCYQCRCEYWLSEVEE